MGWKAFDTLWRKLREGRVTSAKAERVVYVGVFFFNAVQYWREQYNITEWVRLGGATVGHLVLPPCSGRVILQHIAQDCIQIVLEYFRWGRLHTLSVPVLGHQHRKEDAPHVLVELPEHQFLPIASSSCCLAPPRAWWLSQMHWIEIHVQLQEPF